MSLVLDNIQGIKKRLAPLFVFIKHGLLFGSTPIIFNSLFVNDLLHMSLPVVKKTTNYSLVQIFINYMNVISTIGRTVTKAACLDQLDPPGVASRWNACYRAQLKTL